jgi:Helicase conserved C-terminal domain
LETTIAVSPRRVQEKTTDFNLVLETLGVNECFQDDFLSSKIKVCLGIIKKIQRDDKGAKTIIFVSHSPRLTSLTQSDGMWHVVNIHLSPGTTFRYSRRPEDKACSVYAFASPPKPYLLLSHTMTVTGKQDRTQREKALQVIASDPHCSVMLVSMKAGGTGLNITACSNVIILDPWWNPYVEVSGSRSNSAVSWHAEAKQEQAISRVYRMGQTRAVQVYRIIAPNTVEEKITDVCFAFHLLSLD